MDSKSYRRGGHFLVYDPAPDEIFVREDFGEDQKMMFQAAADFMKQNNNEAFHESILKAFQGYLSDKLGIPVSDLNRESAIAGLLSKNCGVK